MRSIVRHPPRRPCGPVIRRPSRARTGEQLAGEIVEDIHRRAATAKLDPGQVMLDVLFGLVGELADAPRHRHQPVELADLVQDAAEVARIGGR